MSIRNVVSRVPGIGGLIAWINTCRAKRRMRMQSVDEIFTSIYRTRRWGGRDSASGPGSDIEQVEVVMKELARVMRTYSIASVLDIPCGDFHWMQKVDLNGATYVGGDIVDDVVQDNQSRYGSQMVSFLKLDLLEGGLPCVDLVFCRDCLVHLSNEQVHRALMNISSSGSKYLMSTTFTDRLSNQNIVTGLWRPLNLLADPFRLPSPLEIINERCSEGGGQYSDKSMGIWRVADLRAHLVEGNK